MGKPLADHTAQGIGTGHTQLDEEYQASLAVKLLPGISSLSLPSTEFLVYLLLQSLASRGTSIELVDLVLSSWWVLDLLPNYYLPSSSSFYPTIIIA